MYARLGFSVAAHVNPDVMIVDEVLSVGDYVFQQKCVQRMKEVIRGGAAVVFVSHNLKSVAEFCHNCLVLERGRPVVQGKADQVIANYMRRQTAARQPDQSSGVKITKVTVRNHEGECVRFESGEKAWVDIELSARKPCQKLSVSL
jgi:ABC-type dipeptide/oligopeptide/nickel transport system ATPase component